MCNLYVEFKILKMLFLIVFHFSPLAENPPRGALPLCCNQIGFYHRRGHFCKDKSYFTL